MSRKKRSGELELDEDLGFQHAEWRVQRVGWAAMVLIILAAAAGAFGRGPLARASTGGPEAGIRVEYERLLRRQAKARMHLELAPPSVASPEARVTIDSALLAAMDIERVTPQPESEQAAPNGVTYTFRLSPLSAPQRVTIDYEASAAWRHTGAISVPDHPPLRLSFFVYP